MAHIRYSPPSLFTGLLSCLLHILFRDCRTIHEFLHFQTPITAVSNRFTLLYLHAGNARWRSDDSYKTLHSRQMTFPTPLFGHVGRGPFVDVYEPAEDSFLLLDALEQDADRLQHLRYLFIPQAFSTQMAGHSRYQSSFH